MLSVRCAVFGLLQCYVIDEETSFLQQDYSISCETFIYRLHEWVCMLLIFLIPLGIPFYFGRALLQAKEDIMRGEGPHHLENLYKEYRPECCMWEIYQLLQKVFA